MLAFKAEDVSFSYKGSTHPALRGINLSVEEGRLVAVMGPAGSGKSTLCMCLNGLIPHLLRGELLGRLVVQGSVPATSSIREMARRVGYLSQDFESQLVCSSVEMEVSFGPGNYAVPRPELRRRVDHYIDLLGLNDLRRRSPGSLSGGQKQLVAIASILALETPLLVMDAAASDLDATNQDRLRKIIRNLVAQGRTVVTVEQDAEAAAEADDVVLLNHGQVVAHSRTREILSQEETLKRCGICPPQLITLFQGLGIDQFPFTVAEAMTALPEKRPLAGWQPEAQGPLTTEPALEARFLSYVYEDGKVEALHDLSLSIRKGDFVAIVGQNGSGKTTLAKLLAGLLRPARGQVWVQGNDARTLTRKVLASLVGYVFQNPDRQIFARTVTEEVSFAPRNFGFPREEIVSMVAEALQAVGLAERNDRDPTTLTRGERQRLAVASILVSRPKVLILDEPTTGLDHPQETRMMAMLARLHRAGHTIVIITHSSKLAAEYASRTVVMRDGAIVIDGQTRDVLSDQNALAAAHLTAPLAVQLGKRLGARVLTIRELLTALTAS